MRHAPTRQLLTDSKCPYLLKSSLHEELLQTIRAVYTGRKAISAEASFGLAEHATDDALTSAEFRVLRLIAHGNANKEIAEQLSVSEETVKGQVRNILSKLGAKDRMRGTSPKLWKLKAVGQFTSNSPDSCLNQMGKGRIWCRSTACRNDRSQVRLLIQCSSAQKPSKCPLYPILWMCPITEVVSLFSGGPGNDVDLPW